VSTIILTGHKNLTRFLASLCRIQGSSFLGLEAANFGADFFSLLHSPKGVKYPN
jgi:hypothetical protein